MKETTIFPSLDAAYHWLLRETLERGSDVRTRGTVSREIIGVSFGISQPRRRCLTNPARKWSFPLALGELAWHFSGSRSAAAISYYAGAWRKLAGATGRIEGSCYGYRIFRAGQSQWDRLKRLLARDAQSRRAVLVLLPSRGSLEEVRADVSCASTMQFLVRGGALHAFVSMRSNDLILGLPYDVFLFSMIQERLARELGISLGHYHHSAVSLHVYQHDLALAERTINCSSGDPQFTMPEMTRPNLIAQFLCIERALRKRGTAPMHDLARLDDYWRGLCRVLEWFARTKRSGLRDGLDTGDVYRALTANSPTPKH